MGWFEITIFEGDLTVSPFFTDKEPVLVVCEIFSGYVSAPAGALFLAPGA